MLKALVVLCFLLSYLQVVTGKYEIFIRDQESLADKNNFCGSICDVIIAHGDFEMIFHFDDAGWSLVDKIMTNVTAKTLKSVSLICYNENVVNGDLFVRPLVRKILHVIILRDMENFALFLNETQNVNEHDEALFIIPSETNITFLISDWHVKLFGKILLINYDFSPKVSINTLCYFCGEISGKLVPIDSDSQLTFDKKEFINFHEHIFKIAFTEYFPFIWCEQVEERIYDNATIHICTKTKGSERELIMLMAKKLNFTFILIMYPDYKPLIEDLEQGKIDFVIGGITATSERAEKTTFTRQYQFEGYHFLYVFSTNLKQELGRVLDPFDGLLWLLLATSIFVTSAVLYALDRFESTEVGRISCLDSLWVCLYMAVEQNANIKQVFKVRPGPAVLLVAWILVCLNVSTAYKSKLSAIVMNPPHREPSDIQELVENGYKFVINERYRDVFVALLLNTSDSVVESAQRLTYGKENLCEEFVYAVENRAAILDEYSSLQYELRKSCRGEIRAKRVETEANGGTLIRITRKSLRRIGQVWLLQKRAAYRAGFDGVLAQIVEAGLVETWRTTHTKEMIKDSFPESHHIYTEHFHSPLTLRLLMSLFLVYAVGNCCAVFAFIMESICHRKVVEMPRKSSRYKL